MTLASYVQFDLNAELNCNSPPEIETSCNASAFAVFASVRNTVLEKYAKTTSEVYRTSNCNSPLPPELSDTIDTESDDEDRISTIQNLPKVNITEYCLTFNFLFCTMVICFLLIDRNFILQYYVIHCYIT